VTALVPMPGWGVTVIPAGILPVLLPFSLLYRTLIPFDGIRVSVVPGRELIRCSYR